MNGLEVQEDHSHNTSHWAIKVKDEGIDTFKKEISEITASQG